MVNVVDTMLFSIEKNVFRMVFFAGFLFLLISNLFLVGMLSSKTEEVNIIKAENESLKNQKDIIINNLFVAETKLLKQEEEVVYSSLQNEISEKYNKKIEEFTREREIGNIQYFINELSSFKLDDDYLRIISAAFYDASIKYDIDHKELIAIAWHENRFNPTRQSKAGAKGIMQVMDLWTKNEDFVDTTGVQFPEDLNIPTMNVDAGAYVYRYYLDYWKKKGIKNKEYRRKLAMLSYNRGSSAVKKDIRKGISPENGYHKVVLSKYKILSKLEEKIFK